MRQRHVTGFCETMENSKSSSINPFLKWAGGKRWLAPRLLSSWLKTQGRYVEPFLGSGAIFFSTRPGQALLSDLNGELVTTYNAIKTSWREVRDLLLICHSRHSKEFYYQTRAAVESDPVRVAARFIYLNRTCWNGLYRVNKRGEFNVPMGTKTNVILDDNLDVVAKALQCATILQQDFERSIGSAIDGDFVYADPPYTVKHKHNGFIKYNENIFSWQDQERLAESIVRAANRGVRVLVSNADHKSVRGLYEKTFHIYETSRQSVISGNRACRGEYPELLISNFELEGF